MTTAKTIFQNDEYVFLPPYGVGKYIGKESMDVGDGEIMNFFKIQFTTDNTISMVPESQFNNSGMRKIVSKSSAQKVMEIFSTAPKSQKGLWNRKMQEYDAKIHSGSIFSIAEVLRDSFSCSFDSSKSYTERAKYKKALDIVTQELSIVFKKTYDEMEAEILDILEEKQAKKKKEDEFDEEFDEENEDDSNDGSSDFDEDKFFANSK